jgi:acyl transferase domain-containing protein/thioesterase domain-containing protein
VSSFGISGTNAHVILEEGDSEPEAVEPLPVPEGGVAWPISAKSAGALRAQASRLAQWTADAEDGLVETGLALSARTRFAHRAVVTGPDRAALVEGLRSVASGVPAPGCALGSPVPGPGVLVYPGQGWQRAGVGGGLLARGGLFADVIGECGEALGRWTDFDLVDVLSDTGDAWLERVDVVQPVLWAVMIGLTRVWESLGLDAPVVVGHSQGEIAAAVVAGALSLEDGARVVAVRSRVIREVLAGSGGMVSLAASAAEAEDWITAAGLTGRVCVAAVNGPHAVTIAGERAAVLPFAGELEARGLRVRVLGVDYASHSPMVERLEPVLRRKLDGIEPRPLAPGRRWLSTVTGAWMRGEDADAGYWYRNLREQVGFAPVVADLVRAGHGLFVEASAHPVLTSGIEQVMEEAEAAGAVTGTLRRTASDATGLLTSAARLFTAGVPIDWPALLADGGPAPAPTTSAAVPGYAFDRSRYWLETPPGALGDLGAAGLSATGHPLLGAAVPLADGGHLLTARLSVAAQPWLADHALGGTVLLAGTALVELALRAGEETGCGTLRELNLHAPVVLPPDGALTLQIVVGAPRPDGTRELVLHTRPDTPDTDEWTRHAGGILADEQEAADPAAFADLSGPTWPPTGAVPLTIDGMYERLAEAGLAYGPAVQALRRAWRVGDAVFAEVSLTDPTSLDALFGLHPALLDAAVQVLGLDGLEGLDTGIGVLAPGTSVMPFSWSDVRLWAGGAAGLRLRVGAGAQGGVAVHAADESGRPVAAVGALVLRPVTAARDAGDDAALVRDGLFALAWQETEAPAPTLDVAGPGRAIDCRSARGDLPEAVHATVAEALRVVQQRLRDEEDEGRPLVLVTRGAVSAVDDEPVADLAGAAAWGLIRSVQSEHPGRVVLLDLPADTDTDESAARAAAEALAARDGEPQLALRDGRLLVPRLVRARIDTAASADWSAVDGTVLVTGATGGLGGALVRHLVASGARDLLLVSRSGMAAPGADALLADVAAAGARVRLTSCDLSRREETAQLFKQLAADGRTLGAVLHLAGVTADSTVEALTADRLGRVLSAKADAAWHLHELTAEHAPAASFVLFSSAAATFGSPGMANYAAANAFLDALATARRAAGLPAASLAWGTWAEAGGMGGRLGDADQQRLARIGDALGTREALRLLDLALAADRGVLIPTRLRTSRLRGLEPAAIPPVLRELVRGTRAGRGAPPAPSWTDRLAGLGPEELREALLALVREQTARVLGHASAEAVPADRAFTELGFDSLTAVEARNALSAATGLRLPATLVFDQPNPRILVEHLGTLLASATAPAPDGAPTAGDPAAGPAAALSDEDANPIARLYIEACEAGRFDEAWGFARAVARLAPTFDGPEDLERAPEPLVLAEGSKDGSGDPLLFCFPSFSPASGPHEYTRFATGLGGRRVLLVRQPGFLAGEPLPESFDALVRVHAETVLRTAGDASFVLVGRSASGWLAYSLAHHLEQRGRGPLAAVLVDTYFGEEQERENLFHGARAMMEREKRSTMLSDVRVTAMGCYEGLIEHWHPEPIAAPTLLVRATEPFSTAVIRNDGVDWRASMTFPHDTRDVPGDHFSMLEEHAEHTALAVESWLHSTFPGRG